MDAQRCKPKPLFFALCFLFFLLYLPSAALAAEVTLSWTQPDDTRVTGYNIYYGQSGTDFQTSPDLTLDSASTTSCNISGLIEAQTYDFAATSFDAEGNESDFSETVTYKVTSSTIAPEDTDDDGDGFTENEGDCNDADASIYPGAIEICGDGIDQDCSGADQACTQTDDVTLSWTRPDDTRVTGYNIYFGKSGTDFKSASDRTIDSAETTNCTIQDLESGAEYSFAATSFDAYGNESGFSETINYVIGSSSTSPEDIDDDGDGYTENQGDCNDSDASVNPGATEICGDGIDQDCNGSDLTCPEDIDDDGDSFTENQGDCNDNDASIHPDADEICGDGIDQDCSGSDLTCPEDIDDDGDGYTENQGDCNDSDASVNPGATEICGDGIDQDCNGSDLTCPEDIDDDGDTFTENQGDCNDNDASIHPNADEICGDGIDQDCSGSDLTCPEDIDDDGDGYTENQGDCNDSDASVNPGATEICGDGIDQDCNGSDLTCPEDIDDDGDTFTENQGDCNDNNASIHPNADEICGDGIDQDCSGSDLTCPEDIDDDGDGYTENQGDCNDSDATVFPGATEICGDGIDQDCNGGDLTCDPNEETQTLIFGDTMDADCPGTVIDTFININDAVNVSSTQLNTYTWPENQPANAILLRLDLSQIPEDAEIQSATLSLYQTEAGGDAAYDVSVHRIINHDPVLSQADGFTCDGTNTWTANDTCFNSIPLAQADIAAAEDVKTLDQSLGYKDWEVTGLIQEWMAGSASNYGLLLNSDIVAGANSYRYFAASEASDAAQRPRLEITFTTAPSPEEIDDDGDGYTENEGDCNDADAAIYPDAEEVCGDGIDQDCNGSDLTCPEDIDDDGDGYTENDGDCNDADATIFPGANEICGDGIDQDCNGSDLTCPEDIDNDNDGYTENDGDCDDTNASINPGAEELCGDGIDQDCNGSDLTCPENIDKDGDGYTENDGDCNDADATIFPGATEICGDGIDQDCSGSDLSCVSEETQNFEFEFGEAEVNHEWKSVSFNKTFENPVVVAKPMSLNGGQPAVIRIRNVTAEGFELRIQEWEYLDGWHAVETASYMVMEAGHHELSTGIHVEAGTFETSGTEALSFEASFNQTPVVISSITTENDAYAVTERLQNINRDGFDCSLQEQEANKNGHTIAETVAYIAWEPSAGTIDGLNYVVDSTFNEVTHEWYQIPFYPEFAHPPVFVADMQTLDGGDTANIRWQNTSGSSIEVQIDEEQSQNSEVNHTTEVVGYMAFDPQPALQTAIFGDTLDADYPGTIKDTFINLNNEVNAASEQLNTYTWPENMPANAILFQFDLSQLPAEAQIQSATLKLYQTEAGGDTAYDVSVHRVINSMPVLNQANGYTYDGITGWTPNNKCYNSIPLAQADIAPAETVNRLDQSLEYKTWEVTSMVEEWLNGIAANCGLMLNSDDTAGSNSYRFFGASEADNAEHRPKLEIVYSLNTD